MRVAEAIAKIILNLCERKGLSINKLAIISGLTQSILQSIISDESQNSKILTLVRMCDSFDIIMVLFGFV